MPTKNPQKDRQSAAVGYLRRSTEQQEQSIPGQRSAIDRYATEHGIQVIRYYIDDAITGTQTKGRKAFQDMMKAAQSLSRDFSFIIVYDIKRFGRVDNDEAGHYRYLLRTNGIEVRYVNEFFTGHSTDDLLRAVKQWQAREESRDLSRVTSFPLKSVSSRRWSNTTGSTPGQMATTAAWPSSRVPSRKSRHSMSV